MDKARKQETSKWMKKFWSSRTEAQMAIIRKRMSDGQKVRRGKGISKQSVKTVQIPATALKKMMKISWIEKLLSSSTKMKKAPKISRKNISSIQKALATDGKALVRLTSRSGKVGVVSPKFYNLRLNYPMNRSGHPVRTKS